MNDFLMFIKYLVFIYIIFSFCYDFFWYIVLFYFLEKEVIVLKMLRNFFKINMFEIKYEVRIF